MSEGSSKATRCCARYARALTCSSTSLSQIEPVSATPKAARTIPTSTSAKSVGLALRVRARVPFHLRGRRADHPRLRKERADESIKVFAASLVHELSTHPHQRFLEFVQQRSCGSFEQRYLRKRGRRGREVRAHRCENGVAARHDRLLCSMYQLRKVCCGASGTSRWRPHGLSQL